MVAARFDDSTARLPSLQGRVVVVTGGGAGAGRASAELLGRLGAAVGVLDRDGGRAGEVVAAIESRAGRALALVADVGNGIEVDAAASTLSERFGACDALVNCTLEAPRAALEELRLEDWDRAVEVNFSGAFACMQAFGAGMLDRGQGSIVNVCPADAPIDAAAAAATAGAGLKMLARLGAVEWGDRGVRVNSVEVCPEAGPEAVAAAVAFLAGDGSSYITGESFEVDKEV